MGPGVQTHVTCREGVGTVGEHERMAIGQEICHGLKRLEYG